MQTDELDGEQSLKSKSALIKINDCISKLISERDLSITVPPPVKNLYDFEGSLQSGDQVFSLDFN